MKAECIHGSERHSASSVASPPQPRTQLTGMVLGEMPRRGMFCDHNLLKHLLVGFTSLLLTSCNPIKCFHHFHDHSCPSEGHGPCYLKVCCNGHPENGK